MIKVAIVHAAYVQPPDNFYDADGVSEDKALSLIYANIDKTLGMLCKAGEAGCDLAVTNEDFADIGRHIRDVEHPGLFRRFVSLIEDDLFEKLHSIAAEYHMLISANEYEIYDEAVYNTTKLFGRDGICAGKYRKVHLPPGERFQVKPGNTPLVLKTDIGNLGFVTCYDIIFPEHSRALALKGADMLILQTQGWGIGGKSSPETGEAFMRVRAAENSVYLIVAKNIYNEGGKSCIIDNYGNMVSSMASPADNLFITEIEPDFEMNDPYHYDNYYAGVTSTKVRQLLGRVPSTYARLTEWMPDFNSERLKSEVLCTEEERTVRIQALNKMEQKERNKYHW